MSEVVELFPARKREGETRGMWFAFDQDGKPVFAVEVRARELGHPFAKRKKNRARLTRQQLRDAEMGRDMWRP